MCKQKIVRIHYWLLITTVFFMTSCHTQRKIDRNEWIVLFDGKNTLAWHSYGKLGVGKGWEVVNGELHLNPGARDGGDLTTNDDFEDFWLQLEWKISHNGNSGILFYVQDNGKYPASFITGPEMQVLDNDGHADALIPKHRAGELYDLVACSQNVAKPAGEWNKVDIKVKKGRLEFYLNRVLVVKTSMWNETWFKLVSGSKFKNWQDFGKFGTGKISLQDHGNEVWYRDIRIKRL